MQAAIGRARSSRDAVMQATMHLRSATGSLVIVQSDLLGGSAVLHRLVARALAAAATDVPAAVVYLGATHTHGGPGQFLGTNFYNRFASNRPGFDAAWAQWLAARSPTGWSYAGHSTLIVAESFANDSALGGPLVGDWPPPEQFSGPSIGQQP